MGSLFAQDRWQRLAQADARGRRALPVVRARHADGHGVGPGRHDAAPTRSPTTETWRRGWPQPSTRPGAAARRCTRPSASSTTTRCCSSRRSPRSTTAWTCSRFQASLPLSAQAWRSPDRRLPQPQQLSEPRRDRRPGLPCAASRARSRSASTTSCRGASSWPSTCCGCAGSARSARSTTTLSSPRWGRGGGRTTSNGTRRHLGLDPAAHELRRELVQGPDAVAPPALGALRGAGCPTRSRRPTTSAATSSPSRTRRRTRVADAIPRIPRAFRSGSTRRRFAARRRSTSGIASSRAAWPSCRGGCGSPAS